ALGSRRAVPRPPAVHARSGRSCCRSAGAPSRRDSGALGRRLPARAAKADRGGGGGGGASPRTAIEALSPPSLRAAWLGPGTVHQSCRNRLRVTRSGAASAAWLSGGQRLPSSAFSPL